MRIRLILRIIGMAVVLALCVGSRQVSLAIDETLPGYVTYTVDDTIYIEVVGKHHLRPGDTGVIKRRGREAAYVRVTEAGERYIYLQVITQASGVELATGDSIVYESRIQQRSKAGGSENSKWHELDKLILGGTLDQNTTYQVSAPWERLPYENQSTTTTVPARVIGPPLPTSQDLSTLAAPAIAAGPRPPTVTRVPDLVPLLAPQEPAAPAAQTLTAQTPAPSAASETLKTSTLKSESPDKNFVPLLAPLAVPTVAKASKSRDSNIFHGRLRLREVDQSIPALGIHTSQSRLDSDGSVERIHSGPWSAVWNGNMTYRDGNNFSSATDFRNPRAHVYTAMLSRKMNDGGSLRLGRILPTELSGIGFLDGGQLEHVYSPALRVGGLLAFRPDRVDLSLGTKEPLAAAYATTEQGTHGKFYYSGTLGLFQSMYRGALDEMAVLYDHRMDLGPKLNLYATTQLDFDVGAAQVHNGPRLTRFDFYGNSPVLPYLSFRSGLSHYERADIAAERDLSGGSLTGFDNGFWRYFVGSNQRLPWKFSTDEEISYINSGDQPSDALWRVSVSRSGLFLLPNAQVTVAVYNVTSTQGKGIAFQGTASTPLWTDRLSLYLASSAQYSSPDASPKNFDVNDASVRLNWRISRAWSFDAGVTQTYQSNITSTIGDGSLSYRW